MLRGLRERLGGVYSLHLLRLLAFLAGATLLLALALTLPAGTLRLRGDMLWNVALALLPLVFALLLHRRCRLGRRGPLGWVLALGWLAFFPNAPYMVTDFIHLDHYTYWARGAFVPSLAAWLGLAHITLAVATGCTAGFLSLYLVQGVVGARFGGAGRGTRAGWAFSAAACLLAGIGIFIGRFLRFNSWDLLHRPHLLLARLAGLQPGHSLLLCLLFAGLTFGGYLLFYLCWHRPGGGENAAAPPAQ